MLSWPIVETESESGRNIFSFPCKPWVFLCTVGSCIEERRWFGTVVVECAGVGDGANGSAQPSLEEKAEDLATQMFSSGLLVVHDTSGGGHHHIAKLTGGQQVRGPLLDICDRDIEPGEICFITKLRLIAELTSTNQCCGAGPDRGF